MDEVTELFTRVKQERDIQEAEEREIERRVQILVDRHHAREAKIAEIREAARLTGELAVQMYLENADKERKDRIASSIQKAKDAIDRAIAARAQAKPDDEDAS